jgi:hypothetical protein
MTPSKKQNNTSSSSSLELRPPKPPCSTPAKARPPSVHQYLSSFTPDAVCLSANLKQGNNTRNDRLYTYGDIKHPVMAWPEFSLESCEAKFSKQLQCVVNEPAVYVSPQQGNPRKEVASEAGVDRFINRSISVQVNRALEAAGCSVQVCGGADWDDTADCAGVAFPERKVHVVGDYKVSWKWRSEWRAVRELTSQDREYRQALSQVHYYMVRHACRWGYIMTDREFVAIERVDGRPGVLKVADAVAWKRDDGNNGLGLPLALWFLHAMASDSDDAWCLRAARGGGASAEQPECSTDNASEEQPECPTENASVVPRADKEVREKPVAGGRRGAANGDAVTGKSAAGTRRRQATGEGKVSGVVTTEVRRSARLRDIRQGSQKRENLD